MNVDADVLHHLRTDHFQPYLDGKGPKFTLHPFDTYEIGEYGKSKLAYKLEQVDNGVRTTLFEGDDFFCSPMIAIDSDDCVKSLMSFLTLKPGDTDEEYFDNYSQKQLEFAAQDAETLYCEVIGLFGEE